jgi:hypothetical protein
MKKRSTLDDFKGTWQTKDEDSRLLIEISEKRGRPHVKARDKQDGENFRIRNLSFKNGALSFELLVPSNGHKTVNRFTFKSSGVLRLELTLFENWTRIK